MSFQERGSRHYYPNRRVSLIFDCLDQNLSITEIDERLNRCPKTPLERGKESVENVKTIISRFSFIESIRETKPNSEEDTIEKRDLVVYLSGEENVGFVGVQVKSSLRNVLNFYKKINKDDSSEVQKKLIKNKLIVLNGQLPDSRIETNFLKQLSDINNFHLNKS